MTPRYPNLVRALAVYERQQALRDKQLYDAETTQAVERVEECCAAALRDLQDAFLVDTLTVNRLSHARAVPLSMLRRMAEECVE